MLNDARPSSVVPTCDSTSGSVYGIDSRHMGFERGTKYNDGQSQIHAPAQGAIRAALYARVSDELLAKEGTIESQVLALKKRACSNAWTTPASALKRFRAPTTTVIVNRRPTWPPPIVRQIVEAEAKLLISGVFDRRPTGTPSFSRKSFDWQRVIAVSPGVQVGRRFTAVPERPRIRQAAARAERHRLRGARQWHFKLRRPFAPAADLRWP